MAQRSEIFLKGGGRHWPCYPNSPQWRKWRVAITSFVPQSVIDKAVGVAYPAACMC